jgi:hypothetical protein
LERRSFAGVSAATWERVKANGRNEHDTIFEDTAAYRGKATTQTPLGAVVLEFEFDAQAERITYTITKRPIFAPSSLIWGGIESMIDRCRSA